MCRVGAQERRNVGGPGQTLETAFLDSLELGASNPQALRDLVEIEPSRLTLVAQQATDRAPRRGFAFQRTPIDLIRHDVPC